MAKYKAVAAAGKLADKQLSTLRKAMAGKERIGLQRNEIKGIGGKNALEEITRLDVIDEIGRVYVRDARVGGPISVELSYQDEGRTLKIFVSPRPPDGA